jgi:hypothetical protein
VQRAAVHFGEHGHRADAQLAAGADDADGDFAAVGDQDFFEHGLSIGRRVLLEPLEGVRGL